MTQKENIQHLIETDQISEETFFIVAESFKALADPTRLRILAMLFASERRVSDLSDHLSVSQSAVSHQLRLLRALDIVRYRKAGREVFYDLADEHVRDILVRTFEHVLID